MSVYHMLSVQAGHKRVLDPLELGLEVVVNHHVVLGTEPGSSGRKSSQCSQLLSQLCVLHF